MNKQIARVRRGLKLKIKNRKLNKIRIVVFRSAMHIYSQIVRTEEKGDLILASASSCEKIIKENVKGSKVDNACEVGKLLAKRAQEKAIKEVAFDRSGYKYHGRIKALACGAREAGLIF